MEHILLDLVTYISLASGCDGTHKGSGFLISCDALHLPCLLAFWVHQQLRQGYNMSKITKHDYLGALIATFLKEGPGSSCNCVSCSKFSSSCSKQCKCESIVNPVCSDQVASAMHTWRKGNHLYKTSQVFCFLPTAAWKMGVSTIKEIKLIY